MPKVLNLLNNCPRRAFVGTVTSTLLHLPATKADIIVSVLPVPVGSTTVAVSVGDSIWLSKACKAPNCGLLNPG